MAGVDVREQARVLARVLNAEMRFPVQLRKSDKTKLVRELCDGIPSREQVSFQQQSGGVAARAVLGEEHVVDEQIDDRILKLFFCIFHGEFVLDARMDIDHVSPFAEIRRKQEKLLAFLNANREFADVFLAESGVDDLFRRDADGKVKGTKYFFKLCYNDIDNLVLMCHACNIKKSSDSPLEWFKQQETYFGEAFVKDVATEGGLQNGVILPKIYRSDPGRDLTISIDGDDICLYEGETQGLGAFAMQWFSTHFQEVYVAHESFYTTNYDKFKKDLVEIRKLITGGDRSGAHRMYSDLRKAMTTCDAVYMEIVGIGAEGKRISDTGSDDSDDAKRRRKTQSIMGREGHFINHEIKKIKKLLQRDYSKAEVVTVCDKCTSLQDQKIISKEMWRDIYEVFERYMYDAKSSGAGGKPTEEEMITKIVALYEERVQEMERAREVVAAAVSEAGAVKKQAAEEIRRRKEEVRLREEEHRLREEETRRREVAEQRAAELTERLARYEAGETLLSSRDVARAGTKRPTDVGDEEESDEIEVEHQDDGKRARGAGL